MTKMANKTIKNTETKRSTRTHKTNTMMLATAVIIALIANFILSVDAIRCHQCNSHLEEDCFELRLNTPRAPRDEQYLRECAGANSMQAFCRKTVTHIELSGERRIVRECGWLGSDGHEVSGNCVSADNEGYHELICNCKEDGCNAAPSNLAKNNQTIIYTLSAITIFVASMLRRSA